jgi:N-acetylglutamate synthase-like GNAT family acetyltransferase
MEQGPESEFRTASPADVSAIVRLVNEAYLLEAFFVRGPRIDEKEVAALLETGGFLLAEGPDGLEGCVYVEPRGAVGYFGLLSVAAGRQGRGLGRRLIAAAEAGLQGARCQIVEILVVNLRKELFPFYARLGYAEAGAAAFPESERSRLLRPCHFVVMRKALEAPSTAR